MQIEIIYFWREHAFAQLVIAVLLGGLIGLERELAGKDPSLRTFALICLGSCVFSIMSKLVADLNPTADPGRIAAQILPGIGFLGAGAIFRGQRSISGITTAALMWLTAAIGMAVGFDQVSLAISATVTALIAIYVLKSVHSIVYYFREKNGALIDKNKDQS